MGKPMTCRYCGHRIVWNETGGWLYADEQHPFGIYRTSDCSKRTNIIGGPSAGHAIKET